MIHMLKYVLFAATLYQCADAYVGIIPASIEPEKFDGQEGCYYSKHDTLLQVDVPFTPIDGATCEKYTCTKAGDIFVEGCGSKAGADNCEQIPPDFTKAFPDCCSKVRCTLPDGQVVVN